MRNGHYDEFAIFFDDNDIEWKAMKQQSREHLVRFWQDCLSRAYLINSAAYFFNSDQQSQ